jgi:TolB protein
MDADGSNQTPLTHDLGNVECGGYGWSPDGSKIVFSANISGERSVWMMNADGSNKRIVTNGSWPEWISENEIAYLDNDSNLYRITLEGKKELLVKDVVLCYSINKNGDVVYKTWDNISIVYDGKKRELTKSSRDLCPVFGPDGRKIAFMSERTGNADIWMIRWEKKFRL